MIFPNCVFCEPNLFQYNKYAKLPCEDSILFEDNNVFICPDISPLTIGHLLLISKKHFNCFGEADYSTFKSIMKFKRKICERSLYSNGYICFEHGAISQFQCGSCISHAHLHLLPVNIDLCKEIRSLLPNDLIMDANTKRIIGAALSGNSYLYFEDKYSGAKMIKKDVLPSQFMRQVIANHLSIQYDWKSNFTQSWSKELFLETIRIFEKT